MKNTEPERLGSQLVNVCLGVLVGAVALWFAVEIIRSIWMWLAGAALVISIAWLVLWRRSRW